MITYHRLFLGSQCDNDCLVCPVRNDEKNRSLTELIHEFDALDDPENIELWGGEPTLHKDLVSLISYARSRGARRIKLVTNARSLAEWDVLTSLAEEGGFRIIISVLFIVIVLLAPLIGRYRAQTHAWYAIKEGTLLMHAYAKRGRKRKARHR